MDSMSFRLPKLALYLYLTHICFDLEEWGNKHPTGEIDSALLFLSFRP